MFKKGDILECVKEDEWCHVKLGEEVEFLCYEELTKEPNDDGSFFISDMKVGLISYKNQSRFQYAHSENFKLKKEGKQNVQ